MRFDFVTTKNPSALFREAQQAYDNYAKCNPVFLRRSGSKEAISQGMRSGVEISSEEDAADVRRKPYQLFPLRENPPNGYRIKIHKDYYLDDPLYENAPCTYIELISVWAMAEKVCGFLVLPPKLKSIDDMLDERDFCLAFAYVYFGIDYEKYLEVA